MLHTKGVRRVGIVLAGAFASGDGVAAASWLPLRSAGEFATVPEVLLAILLAVGFATRFAALGLIVLSSVLHLMSGHYTDHGYWLMAFALVAIFGPGGLALDALVDRALRRHFPQLEGKPAFALEGLPRVVVVGAGFGGLTCAAALARAGISASTRRRESSGSCA